MPRTPRKPGTRRYIFNTLTVISLLLLLAVVGLWVDSFWTVRKWYSHTYVEHETDYTLWVHSAMSDIGAVSFWRYEIKGMPKPTIDKIKAKIIPGATFTSQPADLPMYWWGFKFTTDHRRIAVAVPHWFLALIFATFPAIWLIKWNKRRKLGPNACPSCGYDLTGNESGVCPECGAGAAQAE